MTNIPWTFTGETKAPDLVASGLTGATAASRYVGATVSGAPVSGTFAVGDWIVTQAGNFWVCVTAGTPGTWVAVGPAQFSRITALPAQRVASGDFLVPPHTSTSTTQLTSLNTMFLLPVDVAVPTTFSSIATNLNTVSSGGTGHAIRLGYYGDDGTGARPAGAALNDAGTFDPTATTGDRVLALTGGNQTLQVGRYWLALAFQGSVLGTGPVMVLLAVVTQIGGLGTLANNSSRSWAQGSVSGALPTIGTLVRFGNAPALGLKVA